MGIVEGFVLKRDYVSENVGEGRNHAKFTVSLPAIDWLFANWISDPPVSHRLGSNALGDLFCIDDLPEVHGFASAICLCVCRSNAQSPSLLPSCELEAEIRASRSATRRSNT
ncbi:hypothetical protein HAX54_021221, partial [Datura stramonium]|nr:hypothetical protein [Datura stramonium]